MKPNLTNLLPEERVRALRQLYFLRLAVVGVLLLSVVAIAHGVFLLPSYLYLRDTVEERKAELAQLSTTLAGTQEQEVSARVATLARDATRLAELGTTPKASAAVAAVIGLPREGIRLIGFSFADEPGDGAKMTVSGVAASREDLRAYEQALSNAPYVAAADLPISAYAKERDIEFTITLTGSLTP